MTLDESYRGAAFLSESPEATLALGAALGRCLESGDVVALTGGLGAGKTVFVKGVATGLGIDPNMVTSSTYTLAHVYEAPGTRSRLFHLDLYRIEEADAVEAIGWDETVGKRGVTVIEWAERAGPWLPADRLDVWMEPAGETARHIVVAWRVDRSERRLQHLLSSPAWASRRLPNRPVGVSGGLRECEGYP